MIPVTKTFLPPQAEYNDILKKAWNTNWITNRGELVLELEKRLKDYLNSSELLITNNGTIPLQLAIKAMQLKGEIITTPFSYVATVSSIVWEHCTPVFVDIDKEYLTIDDSLIEEAITKNTVAILGVHVYGNPCYVDNIEQIAKKHSLKVIYDAAHAFGVRYNGQSLFNYGDVSTCSFHATKLFHTGEGGAIFVKNKELFNTIFYHHNFGHNGQERFHGLGINGKVSELQAAMGLAVFPYIDDIISKRKEQYELYVQLLQDCNAIRLQKIRTGTTYNYAYFPVVFNLEAVLLKVKQALEGHNIFPRRYFFPSLSDLPYLTKNKTLPNATSISKRVLCLPLYFDLNKKDVQKICDIVLDTIKEIK